MGNAVMANCCNLGDMNDDMYEEKLKQQYRRAGKTPHANKVLDDNEDVQPHKLQTSFDFNEVAST